MFDDIGSKIKGLAYLLTILGIIVSVIYGTCLMFQGTLLFGFLIVIVGSLASWIGSFLLYGVGEIIEQLESLNSKAGNIIHKFPGSSQDMKNPQNIKPETDKNSHVATPAYHKWRCGYCGKTIDANPCPYCGN